MKDYLFRCSSLGKLMTEPRSKSERLSETTKTYLKELVIEKEFGIRKEISSRYLDKGLDVEDKSIELVEDVYNFAFMSKNTDRFNNEYITGEPDVITTDLIIDVKSSWDGTTFPWFDEKLSNKDYYWQMQGYMMLTGKQNALLAYCLVDTPEDIVLDEIRREAWKRFEIEPSDQTEEEVRARHNFSHIPKKLRVKAFEISYNDQDIERLKSRIDDCRMYMAGLVEILTVNK